MKVHLIRSGERRYGMRIERAGALPTKPFALSLSKGCSFF